MAEKKAAGKLMDNYDSKKLPSLARASPTMFMYFRSLRLREKELENEKTSIKNQELVHETDDTE